MRVHGGALGVCGGMNVCLLYKTMFLFTKFTKAKYYQRHYYCYCCCYYYYYYYYYYYCHHLSFCRLFGAISICYKKKKKFVTHIRHIEIVIEPCNYDWNFSTSFPLQRNFKKETVVADLFCLLFLM